MGRKRIQKAPKESKQKEEESEHSEPEVVEPKKKGAKGKKAPVQDASLFSDSFNKRIEQFKNFYNDFLTLKGTDSADQFNKVIEQVSSDLEKACANVLKNDISGAEKWIENQTVAVKEQIQSTSDAESSTRDALNKAGTFSASQIQAHIDSIRLKGKNLQKTLEGFEELRNRAQQIYKQSGMDEQ